MLLQTVRPGPEAGRQGWWNHNSTRRSLNALRITETELKVMAALAQMGLIRIPITGYSTPAATGTPTAL